MFTATFTLTAWTRLPVDEKEKHTIEQCMECRRQHLSLTRAFPDKKSKKLLQEELPVIQFSKRDLESPTRCGRKALRELNAICQEQFHKPVQTVINDTPKSRLILKPSSQEKQSETRKTVRATKKAIQQSMDATGTTTVMGNRLSWRKFDKIRKDEALESNVSTPNRKRSCDSQPNDIPPSKRVHGSLSSLSSVDKESLLTEARSWTDKDSINWSELARKYHVPGKNGGQSVKEFLKDHMIPAASIGQQEGRTPRRKRKTLPGGLPFPMQRSSSFHKQQVMRKIESSEIDLGDPVVPTLVRSFKYNKKENVVVESQSTFSARKISLLNIHKKLLKKHEQLGIIRRPNVDSPTNQQLDVPSESESQPEPEPIKLSRNLKIWHDHSSVGGHGHFLVLVSVLYDPAIFLTQEEVEKNLKKDFDVQSTVEAPEIHIFGRSTSSLEDQATFNACRKQCLKELSVPLYLTSGEQVTDIMRFFHADGPAQQFEAGNTVGGNYCCVACGVKADRIDDLAYAFRCQQLDLQERQDFLLRGVAWKNIAVRPLDKLLLKDLQTELRMRDFNVKGKKKPTLEEEFDSIRLGISNFPALLQDEPQAKLKTLHLENYEVSPTEPLHDLKGHLANIIDETLHIAMGAVREELQKIKAAVLTKETLRCSDYRKAIILMYVKLRELQPDDLLTDLHRTAVEITNLCYAHDNRRTPKSVLCLYNRTFLHAHLCSVLFSAPKSTTKRRMFGRFFHSISTHAPCMYRLISLRSLNTEQQERKFQQAKAITRCTSNYHGDHIITNVLERLHFEQTQDSIGIQKNEIKSLSAIVGPMKNTVIPTSIMNNLSSQYQAHLERISDYLICGPGQWWRRTSQGIEFFDGSDERESRDCGPELQHFSSSSLAKIQLYLFEHWERCCETNVELPATFLRCYGQDGSLEELADLSSET